jgi:hypothetical protein
MNDTAKQYSAFWPVLLVFLCFTVTNLLNLYGNLETRSNLRSTLVQLKQGAMQAQAKKEALSGLAQDLIALSPTSPVAQQIVTDFHIQLRNPPAGQPAAPAPSAPPATNAPKP